MTFRSLIPHRQRKQNGISGRRQELSPLADFQEDMNRLFEDFFRSSGIDLAPFERFFGGSAAFVPKVDVVENDKEIVVAAELPGMDAKDVEVSLDGGALTIRGEKKSEHDEKSKHGHRFERTHGAFYREIVIGSEVDDSRANATFKKGVLTVTLPKTAASQSSAKRIAVKSE